MLNYLACHCILTSLFLFLWIKDITAITGAKMYLKREDNLLFPTDFELSIKTKINQFELCHVNNNHYDICLCTDRSFPEQQPYQSNTASSFDKNYV